MSYLQLYVHLVWSTFGRSPLINERFERQLWSVIAARCRALGAKVFSIGGMPDYVHVLVSPIAKLVGDLKGGSSHAMTHEIASGRPFRWQSGFGAFTLRGPDVPMVGRYIRDQRRHHSTNTALAEWEPPQLQVPSRPGHGNSWARH